MAFNAVSLSHDCIVFSQWSLCALRIAFHYVLLHPIWGSFALSFVTSFWPRLLAGLWSALSALILGVHQIFDFWFSWLLGTPAAITVSNFFVSVFAAVIVISGVLILGAG